MLYNVSYDGTQIVPIKKNRQRLFDGSAPERCNSLSVAERESHWVFEPVVINKDTHDPAIEKQTKSLVWNSELHQLEEQWITVSKSQDSIDNELENLRNKKTDEFRNEADLRIQWLFGNKGEKRTTIAELKAIKRGAYINNKRVKNIALTQNELDEETKLLELEDKTEEIRKAENTATESLATKKSLGAIKSVKPTWPVWSVEPEVET